MRGEEQSDGGGGADGGARGRRKHALLQQAVAVAAPICAEKQPTGLPAEYARLAVAKWLGLPRLRRRNAFAAWVGAEVERLVDEELRAEARGFAPLGLPGETDVLLRIATRQVRRVIDHVNAHGGDKLEQGLAHWIAREALLGWLGKRRAEGPRIDAGRDAFLAYVWTVAVRIAWRRLQAEKKHTDPRWSFERTRARRLAETRRKLELLRPDLHPAEREALAEQLVDDELKHQLRERVPEDAAPGAAAEPLAEGLEFSEAIRGLDRLAERAGLTDHDRDTYRLLRAAAFVPRDIEWRNTRFPAAQTAYTRRLATLLRKLRIARSEGEMEAAA